MVKPKKPLLGQVTFRLPPEVHQEIIDVARTLGVDLSSLITQMLAEVRPAFLRRATDLAKRQEAARKDFEEIAFSLPALSGPLLQLAMDAGRPLAGAKRTNAMIEAVAEARRKKDPPLIAIVSAASAALENEETRKQIEQAVRAYEEDAIGDPDADY
jgi:hypothetical protein